MSLPYHAPPPMSCLAIRDIDQHAIERLGIPGVVLMENAARSVAEIIFDVLPGAAARVLVLCGPGNNGGDGFVVARHLHIARVQVEVAVTDQPATPDAATNFEIVKRMDVRCIDVRTPDGLEAVRAAAAGADVIVDALLGTGARGAPRGTMAELILIANSAPGRRVAVDIPSGLDGDTGQTADSCFRADLTVTLVAEKLGFSQPGARALTGRIAVVGIGAPSGPSPVAKNPVNRP